MDNWGLPMMSYPCMNHDDKILRIHIYSGVRRGGEHLSADVHLAGRPHARLQALPGHPQELILPLSLEDTVAQRHW